MASKLNQLNCTEGNYNISDPDCPFVPGLKIGSIFGPNKMVIPATAFADEAAFRAFLEAASQEDNPNLRIYAVGQYEDWADTSEAASDQTFGSGLKRRIREASMQQDYTLPKDRYYHERVKRTLHNKFSRFGELEVLDQGDGTWIVMGQAAVDSTGAASMKFFGLNVLNVSNYQRPTGSTVGLFTIQLGYSSPIAVDTQFVIMQVNFNPLEVMKGLQDVDLTADSGAADQITVSGYIRGAGSLASLYGTELEETGAWVVTNNEPTHANYGKALVLLTVTLVGDAWEVDLTPTATDPNNPGSGKKVSIRLADPSDLATLPTPVEGITSDTAVVTLT